MNTKLVAKVSIIVAIVGMTVCLGLGLRSCVNLFEKDHQADIQKYESDFKQVKAGGMDILDEYSKISTLHTAIKAGFLKSAEIGTDNVEIAFLHALSKERARKELEKRMKDYPVDSESFKAYKWLLDNLDDPEPKKES
jgi:hypothetical protein